ncbi:MAG: hypothetical protein HYY03_07195 [Chloroflexi bacterium]|nr:hypothetical protein [Chloroflexota bacterium]
MSDYHFERECRTPHSESYIIELEDDEVGRVDIHYSPSVAYATLCVAESLTDEDIRELIGEIDERLVLTTDPFREDFVITVWAGREAAVYSDEDFEGEEEEEEEEDVEGDGHRAD